MSFRHINQPCFLAMIGGIVGVFPTMGYGQSDNDDTGGRPWQAVSPTENAHPEQGKGADGESLNQPESSQQATRAHLRGAREILFEQSHETWHCWRRIREAERLCGQALQLDGELLEAWELRALSQAWLGEWCAADRSLAYVKEKTRGGDGEILSKEQIAELEEEVIERLKPLDMRLRMGSCFDTNVPLIGGNVTVPRDFGRRRDFRFGIGFDFDARLHQDDRLEIGVGGGVSNSWHADLDMYDEQAYAGLAYVRHRAFDWLEVGLRYDYEFRLLGREDYLSRHALMPYLSLLEDDRGRTTIYYVYEPRRFFDVPGLLSRGPFDRTGDVQGVGISQAFGLCRLKPGDLILEVGYRHENVSTAGTEYDSRAEILSAGLAVPVVEPLTFQVTGEWAWEDYRERSTLDGAGRGRRDFVQTYGIGLVYEIDEHVSLHGDILWTNDDSNVLTSQREAVFSYERVIYGVGVTVSF